MSFFKTARCAIVATFLYGLLAAAPALAADELLVYVFAGDVPAAGTEVQLDQSIVGKTSEDGSLLVDISGQGTHIVTVEANGGAITARFVSSAGQLVDAVVQLESGETFVDVYGQTESNMERKSATEGTLNIRVLQGDSVATNESIYIAGLGASMTTNSSGEASITLPRGRYRTQVAEKTANLRVVGGLTRSVVLKIDESAMMMQVAAPTLEEVIVIASFDPAGLELSERDTTNIVDTC